MPSARTRSSDMRSTADAPSVKPDELPAVTEPNRRSKTGRNADSASRDVSGRMPLSFATVVR